MRMGELDSAASRGDVVTGVATVKVATVRDFRDRATEWLRSEDVVLVTATDTQPASGCPGTSPTPCPTSCAAPSSSGCRRRCGSSSVPPASRRRTSSQTSKFPDVLVVDANVLLPALIGGRASDALAEFGPGHVRAADEVGGGGASLAARAGREASARSDGAARRPADRACPLV